jgi:ATP-dependent RNA/DNA helicase IGHMBP2
MHKDIAEWASTAMYHGKLLSHESVRSRKLADLPQINSTTTSAENKQQHREGIEHTTLMLIDTTGCDMHETSNDAGSRYNEGEAGIVVSHVNSLISLGLSAQDIAVITPYNGQVELLRKLLLPSVPKLEIRSVDGFQGGEREAVVLSLVRSSDRGGRDGIGFLRDARRLNVAVTRAKRHCAVICDVETVSQDDFIKGVVEWMEEHGEYFSAAEDIPSAKAQQKVPVQNKSNVKAKEKTQATPSVVAARETKSRSNKVPMPQKEVKDNTEAQRIALMERIRHFSETMTKGDELALGRGLSEYDSVVAKELASKLGLGYREHDGELFVFIKTCRLQSIQSEPKPETATVTTSAFAQLDVNDDESSSDDNSRNDGDDGGGGDDDDDDDTEAKDEPSNLLRQLALEREQRRKEQQPAAQAKTTSSSKKSKKKKKGGQKVGGGCKQSKPKSDGLDDLDDMAFLDAQIDKVQNSHGRKVEGSGTYKTIVNGILLSKPKPQEKKKNLTASSQLQSKLNAKAQDRKVKKKKK